MRTRSLILSTLLTAALTTSCGGDDPETDDRPDDPTTEAPAAMSDAAQDLDLTCEFEPNEDPDVARQGIATVRGENTTDVRIDSLDVTLTLEGPDGELETSTTVDYFMPGEELALWTPVFEEYDGELGEACTVSEVTGREIDATPEIDPEGATCEVSGAPGRWQLTADLTNVQSVPFESATTVGVAVEVAGQRYAMNESELDPGELELRTTTNAEEEPTCSVRYFRDR